MYKVILKKNNRYWDPKTGTHLKQTEKTRIFDDEFIENNDMSNIRYAISVGVLEKVELEDDSNEEPKESREDSTDNEQDQSDAEEVETKPAKEEDADQSEDESEEDIEVLEESDEDIESEDKDEEFEDTEEPSEEDSLRCKAHTSSGDRCKNDAKYPEDSPEYCGVHKDS